MPARLLPCLGTRCAIVLLCFACGASAIGQEPGAGDQLLIDADALVVGTDVTTRCSIFDSSLDYLTPLEQVGASLRLGEILVTASEVYEDVADRLAQMRADAARLTCGADDLVPYMDFSRTVAHDMIDIALVAWRTIDIGRCSYFADDDFMLAADRARAAAEAATIEGEPNRLAFINERAAAWVDLFAQNCGNLRFDPVETVPGQIALALPAQ